DCVPVVRVAACARRGRCRPVGDRGHPLIDSGFEFESESSSSPFLLRCPHSDCTLIWKLLVGRPRWNEQGGTRISSLSATFVREVFPPKVLLCVAHVGAPHHTRVRLRPSQKPLHSIPTFEAIRIGPIRTRKCSVGAVAPPMPSRKKPRFRRTEPAFHRIL